MVTQPNQPPKPKTQAEHAPPEPIQLFPGKQVDREAMIREIDDTLTICTEDAERILSEYPPLFWLELPLRAVLIADKLYETMPDEEKWNTIFPALDSNDTHFLRYGFKGRYPVTHLPHAGDVETRKALMRWFTVRCMMDKHLKSDRTYAPHVRKYYEDRYGIPQDDDILFLFNFLSQQEQQAAERLGAHWMTHGENNLGILMRKYFRYKDDLQEKWTDAKAAYEKEKAAKARKPDEAKHVSSSPREQSILPPKFCNHCQASIPPGTKHCSKCRGVLVRAFIQEQTAETVKAVSLGQRVQVSYHNEFQLLFAWGFCPTCGSQVYILQYTVEFCEACGSALYPNAICRFLPTDDYKQFEKVCASFKDNSFCSRCSCPLFPETHYCIRCGVKVPDVPPSAKQRSQPRIEETTPAKEEQQGPAWLQICEQAAVLSQARHGLLCFTHPDRSLRFSLKDDVHLVETTVAALRVTKTVWKAMQREERLDTLFILPYLHISVLGELSTSGTFYQYGLRDLPVTIDPPDFCKAITLHAMLNAFLAACVWEGYVDLSGSSYGWTQPYAFSPETARYYRAKFSFGSGARKFGSDIGKVSLELSKLLFKYHQWYPQVNRDYKAWERQLLEWHAYYQQNPPPLLLCARCNRLNRTGNRNTCWHCSGSLAQARVYPTIHTEAKGIVEGSISYPEQRDESSAQALPATYPCPCPRKANLMRSDATWCIACGCTLPAVKPGMGFLANRERKR